MGEIGYINPKAQGPEIPDYKGSFKKELVPDTIDLADMAHLAVHGLTSPTNPEADYEVYWKVKFKYNPPMMHHEFPDTGIRSKFHIALPLMRIMSGSEENKHIEKAWLDVMFRETGPEGLIVTPLKGRPWGLPSFDENEGIRVAGNEGNSLLEPQHNGHCLSLMSEMYQLTHDSIWRDRSIKIVDEIKKYVLFSGDEAYFPYWFFKYGEKVDASYPRPEGLDSCCQSWLVFGLNMCYRTFGYEPAKELAGQLLRYSIRSSRYFDKDAGFLLDIPDASPEHARYGVIHFHAHTLTVLHGLDYAMMTGDSEIMEFALKGYEKALSYGRPMLGWYPERIEGPCYPAATELCCVADMIMMSSKMARAGIDDSQWDIADKALRNQFAECQIKRVDWVDRYNMGTPPSQPPEYSTTDDVMQRNIGAFIGWSSVNEQVLWQRERQLWRGIMHCCTGNSARALYIAWRDMLSEEKEETKVHLLMNRAGRTVDVNSHIPYTGRVDVHVKNDTVLKIRIPEWVKTEDVRLIKDGQPAVPHGFDGRYADCGGVAEGSCISMIFPIKEKLDSVEVQKQTYYAVRKGNDIVEIDPHGQIMPLYRREHYRENMTRWVEKERYYTENPLPEI